MNTYILSPKDSLHPFVQRYIVLEDIHSAAEIAKAKLFTAGKQYRYLSARAGLRLSRQTMPRSTFRKRR